MHECMGAPAHLAGRQCSSLLYSCTTALLYMIPSSIYNSPRAGVAELVDAGDSKSPAFTGVPVRVRAPAPANKKTPQGVFLLVFRVPGSGFQVVIGNRYLSEAISVLRLPRRPRSSRRSSQ